MPGALSSGAARRWARRKSLAVPTRVAGTVLLTPGVARLRYLIRRVCLKPPWSGCLFSVLSQEGVGRERSGKGGLVALSDAHLRGSKSRVWERCLSLPEWTADPFPCLPGEKHTATRHDRPDTSVSFFFQLQSLTVRAASATRGFSPRLLRTAVLRPQLLPFAGRRDNSKRWITRLVCR